MTDTKLTAQRLAQLSPAGREQLLRLLRQRSRAEARPIEPRPASISVLPCSFAQQRLWFLEQLDPGTAGYNLGLALRLLGTLNQQALGRSLDEVVRRHEALRTTFGEQDGEPTQLVAPQGSLPLTVVDLRDLPAAERLGEALRRGQAEMRRPFDLTTGPLLRATLLRLGEEESVLCLIMHHIVTDGWSTNLLLGEVVALYAAFAAGRASPLPEPPIQYADFALWQRERLQGPVLEEHLGYWRGRLAGLPELELPTDRPRPSVRSFGGASIDLAVDAALTERLRALAARDGATLFMVLAAAFQVLLGRYSGQADFALGTTAAGRDRPELEGLIGFFVNTLALRADLSGDPTFLDLLQRVRTTTLDAFAHQELPFEKLVDELQPERRLDRNPLVQVLFNVQQATAGVQQATDLRLEVLNLGRQAAAVDLTVYLTTREQGLVGVLEYSTDLFDAATIERLWASYLVLLAGIAADPGRRLSALPLLSAADERQLAAWNATERPYDLATPLHEQVAAQARRTPDAVAVAFAGDALTYRALDERAGRLARVLAGLGVGPEVRMGVCLERSLALLPALLGVLRAGGAYVPLDPGYPAERLAYMLEDAGCPVVLCHAATRDRLPATGAVVLDLDALHLDDLDLDAPAPDLDAADPNRGAPAGADAAGALAPPLPVVDPEHLAYAIYTSGSTGRPKGALNTHRGIGNRLWWMQEQYGLGPDDAVLQKTPLGFDVSVWELFWPLLVGARLVLAPPGAHQDPAALAALVAAQAVTTVHFVPSMLAAFLEALGAGAAGGPDACRSLRRIICSGEALAPDLAARCRDLVPWAALWNLYGPTEAAVDVTAWHVPADGELARVPIGRPIANTRGAILDRQGRLLPVGAAGELVLGGVQVGRGYLGRPALTAERFVPDPDAPEPGARRYRTGDRARWLPDGTLEYLGRLDQQVKLRGQRLELGEVEAALRALPGVGQAAAALREDRPGQPRLVGYVVPADGACAPTLEAVRRDLGATLPAYMLPSALVALAALPLSPSGKLDRRALPAPEPPQAAEAYVAPRTPAEELLAGIWSAVLGVERVGAADNFFALGGDSILSLRVVARAGQAGLRIAPRQVFQHQMLAALAAAATPLAATTAPGAEQGPVTGPTSLTPIQRWFFEQDQPDAHHFNQALLLAARERLDPAPLEQAVQALLTHHDALRLRFHRDGAIWRQEIAGVDESSAALATVDLGSLPADAQAAAWTAAVATAQGSLDLEHGPLLRAVLLRAPVGEPDHVLLVIHHLAVDGVSWRVLLVDLATAYEQSARGEAVALPPKTASVQSWVAWLAEQAQSESLLREAAVWARTLPADARPLPVDCPDGVATMATARTAATALSAAETQALAPVAAAYRAGVEDLLLTALAQALLPWIGGDALVVDREGHGRDAPGDAPDVSRTVGWFTALHPVGLRLTAAQLADPGAALKAVKEQGRAIPGRGIGYGLLRYLCPDPAVRERTAALPRSAVLFNYLGRFEVGQETDAAWRLSPRDAGPAQSARTKLSHALAINGWLADGRLQFTWLYSTERYRPETVERLAAAFGERLRALLAHGQTAAAGGRTPADFPLARLGQGELDAVLAHVLPAAGGATSLAARLEEIVDLYELSPLQQGLFFHSQFAGQSGMYVQQLSFLLRGALDLPAFERAWGRVAAAHPVLRTTFHFEPAAKPLQVVHRQVAVPLDVEDWRGAPQVEQEARLEAMPAAERARGFDPAMLPLMRLRLVRLADDVAQFTWTYHHLLFDGWSVPLVLADVFRAYAAERRGEAAALPARRPYRDYLAWLQRQDGQAAEHYWREALRGFTSPTPLPFDHVNQAAAGQTRHAEYVRSLSPALTAELQALARRAQVTLNTLVQGAWALLLSRYAEADDVLFGATLAGRPAELPDVEAMVGLFINTLPVRVRTPADALLLPWLQELQAQQAELRQYEHSFLVDVQGWSGVPRGTPLFHSLVVFENYPVEASALDGAAELHVEGLRSVDHTNYPLTLLALPGRAFTFTFGYDPDLFEAATIERLAGQLATLLEGIAADPGRRLSALPLLPAAEAAQLAAWNATDRDYDLSLPVPARIAAQAARTPDAVAVAFAGEALSYRALDQRAGRLARVLAARGVGPGALVGICLERTLDLVPALLGVLRVGGAYVPLDPGYPAERLAYMLEDARPAALLCDAATRERLPASAAAVVDLDAPEPEPDGAAAAGGAAPPPTVRPGDLAYVIYTSGSTGRPKGVGVPHGALANFLVAMQERLGLGPGDRLLAVTTLAFDIAALELFLPLTVGAQVVMASRAVGQDGAALAGALAQGGITHLQATPATWRLLLAAGWAGTPGLTALCGGEALPADLAQAVGARTAALWNLYGPTEATVWATAQRVERAALADAPAAGGAGAPAGGADAPAPAGGATVPIGTPLANTRGAILDRHGRSLPVGAAGELSLGGVQVARGYLGRPGLTAEKFVPDPDALEPGARRYRTGDRARWRADGTLAYLGRLDQQVKLRGFRIELGEVEAALRAQPGVGQAAAALREDRPGQPRLVAYVVGRAGAPPPPADALRQSLAATLPAYMLPAAVVPLAALPLTPNGKLDRKALPAPDGQRPSLAAAFVAPRTDLEQRIAAVWREVLGLDRVGMDDNFFDLGGHSLLVLQVRGRLRAALARDLDVPTLFRYPTVRTLARSLTTDEEPAFVGRAQRRAQQQRASVPDARPNRMRTSR